MTWRVVQISKPAQLCLQHKQLVVKQDGQQAALPLEDVAVIVLETPQAILSSALLAAAQDAGVAIITCDTRHMPNGVLLPFHTHSRLAEVAALQIAAGQPCRKRLWQRIVQQKILNQAACLQRHERPQVNLLQAMARRVSSGDIGNIEAQAARIYWQALFGDAFRRHHADHVNAALNYGYAVLRGVVARSLVAAGLLPCFGVHHSNNLNAFRV
jgi:CRISP-associated protein Cas1